jgi:glycosyltransferase involved in cell wall biosynthesis
MNQTISPHPCAHLYGWEISDRADPGSFNNSPKSASVPLRFSVVIPTLNQAKTIEDTLLSLIHQNYPDLEIIVADGGSSDGTAAILNRYREELSAVLPGPDTGQSNAINKGFAQASGDIFFWLNSDDYLLPHTLWRVAACFQADAHLELAVGAGDVISFDHRFLRHIPPLPMDEATMLNWKNDQWVMQQCCFWTKNLWQSVGGVDEQLHLLMDYDLWFRFSCRTKAAMIKEKLAVMRYYPEAKTVKQRSKTSEELAYVYAKNGAFASLREQVAGLVAQRETSENYLNRIHGCLPVRLLKRLSFFPTPANPGP